jgi:hypothetical protein
MSDVSVSIGVTGKDQVLGAFSQVGAAAKKLGSIGLGAINTAAMAGAAASIAAIGASMAGMKGALDLGGAMVDLSNRTGVAVESLYGLRIAFKDAGVDAEKLGPAVNKMQKALASAVGGGKEGDVLKGLGLDPQSLASMDSGQAFAQIGNAIAQLPNSVERSAAAMALFGKSGGELLQVFMDPNFKSAGNISETARLLGENAGIFDKASDSLGRVGPKLQGLFVGMASGMTGLLDSLANGIDGIDLAGIGKSIGDAIGLFIAAFTSGNFTTIISSAFMIGIKESINFLAAGFFAVFQTIPAYISTIGKNFVAYFELLTNPEFWSGLKDSFLSVAAAFRGTMLMGVANILDALRNLPGIGEKMGKASDFVSKLSADQFQQSAAYSESAANGGMSAAVSKLGAALKDNMIGLGSEFMNNFRGNGQIMGNTDAERAALSGAIADTITARDEANAKATADNASRVMGQSTFNGAEIGQVAKQSIFADSLAKIGGGGISVGGGSNPILEENKRQTSLLQSINQNLAKGMMSPVMAEFAPSY